MNTETPELLPMISTHSGGGMDFLNPKMRDISINDIAEGLSKTCRFGGQCRGFYSVAEHSIYVSRLVPPEIALDALLHDASEAYLGDMPTPIKQRIPAFKEIENRLQKMINQNFGVDSSRKLIKAADLIALATEKRQLIVAQCGEIETAWAFLEGVHSDAFTVRRLDPDKARIEFLEEFRKLRDLRDERKAQERY